MGHWAHEAEGGGVDSSAREDGLGEQRSGPDKSLPLHGARLWGQGTWL